jgi:hypothetical protein
MVKFNKIKKNNMSTFKKVSRLVLAGAIVAAFTNSCTNLDETIYDTIPAQQFYKTSDENIAALGAAYTKLYGFAGHNGIFSIQEVSSDEMIIPTRGADWGDGGQWTRMYRHEFLPTEESFNNTWNFCFGGISDCNRLIYQFELQNSPTTKPFIAELKVLRAMFYYWLLDLYGNVPIVSSFKDAPKAPANNTRAEVYAFVEKELRENVDLLSKAVDATTYARMNYYVGKALQAKLYLNAQVYTGTARWTEALAACNAIINDGKYQLSSSYADNFKTVNQGSKELILAIPYDQVNAKGFNLPAMTLHYQSQKTYNLAFQPWNGYCTVADFYNSYDNADLRKRNNFIAGPQFASDGSRLTDDQSEANDPDGRPLTFTPELNEHFPGCLRQAGARVGKYEFAAGATENLSNDFPLLRYADILLMKAECLWRADNNSAEAVTIVNSIRTRAGVTNVAAPLTAANLLAERGREMFAEAYRRQDMIRFGTFLSTRTFKPAASGAHRVVFPIPTPQLNANSNLRQNTGY